MSTKSDELLEKYTAGLLRWRWVVVFLTILVIFAMFSGGRFLAFTSDYRVFFGEDEDVKDLWLKFNEYSNKLTIALGRTSNIVGEYAEYLAHKHYGGRLLEISGASADIEAPDGTLYQVKSRKIKGTPSTQLNVIRSWDFDFLVVILFEANGAIKKAIQVPVEVAKEYGKSNSHQNGWVITTSQKFLNDHRATDITIPLSVLNK